MIADFTIPDWIGILGSIVIVSAYFAVSTGRVSGEAASFHAWNLTGALLLLFSLWFRPNAGAILIEVLWALIAIGALIRWWRR